MRCLNICWIGVTENGRRVTPLFCYGEAIQSELPGPILCIHTWGVFRGSTLITWRWRYITWRGRQSNHANTKTSVVAAKQSVILFQTSFWSNFHTLQFDRQHDYFLKKPIFGSTPHQGEGFPVGLHVVLCIRETPKRSILQTVKTQMKCHMMCQFIRFYTVC